MSNYKFTQIAFITIREIDFSEVRKRNLCNKICNILSNKKIEYCVRTNYITNLGRSHGVPFINSDFSFEYRIYVKRINYEEAVKIIN